MQSVFGRYLDVDLRTEKITSREIPESWYELHLGGRGIASRLLLDLVPADAPAFDDASTLVFATGPLQGTGLAGAGRHVVAGKSPKTGSIADAYTGGFFGHELGCSGYDGIVVHGRSSLPLYLLLQEGKAELRSAKDLWGKETHETDAILRNRHSGARVATIGPAGESLVTMACIMHDVTRAAGRPGFGAVMGHQRLKAVVVKGHTKKVLADPEQFTKGRAAFARALANDPGLTTLGQYGTGRGVLPLSELGILPTRNFQEGVFDEVEAISGQRMAETILVGRDTCAGCPIRCKRVVKSDHSGRAVLPDYGGPEYETLAAFGSLCLCSDLPAIALANQLCNAYGLDTISCGVAIATLMEASERGLIEEQVPWGSGNAIVRWVERIARREGLGDEIAKGLDEWARSIGANYAMAIKGVEVPLHDPRGKQGFGLSYAASPRGATHMEGMHDTMLEIEAPTPELGVTQSVDRLSLSGKAELAVLYENLRSFTNSLVMCAFTNNMVGPNYNYPEIRELLEFATGISLTAADMLTIGARNLDLMRLYSGLAGQRRKHDDLPERFYTPLPKGGSSGCKINRKAFHKELDSYYTLRGWDSYGPTDEHLLGCNLKDLCGRLRRR